MDALVLPTVAPREARLASFVEPLMTYAGAGPATIEELAKLLDASALAPSTDIHGASLFENLQRLATRSLQPALTQAYGSELLARGELLREVIHALAVNGSVSQTSHSTCAVTDLDLWLFRFHKSEAVRLVMELLTQGSTQMAGGDRLTLPQDGLASASSDNRGPVQSLLQTALMNAAVAATGMRYDVATDHIKTVPDPWGAQEELDAGSGLSDLSMARVEEQLFGMDYQIFHPSRNRPEEALGGVTLDDWLSQNPSPPSSAPIILAINTNVGLHAEVFVERLPAGDRMATLNPWGATTNPTGDGNELGDALPVDTAAGEWSYGRLNFDHRLAAVHIPSALLPPPRFPTRIWVELQKLLGARLREDEA